MPDLLHNAILPDARQLRRGGGRLLMPQGGSGPALLFFFNSDLPPPPHTPNQLPWHSSKTSAEDISLSSPPFSFLECTPRLPPNSRKGNFLKVKERKTLEESEMKGGAWRNHTSYPPAHYSLLLCAKCARMSFPQPIYCLFHRPSETRSIFPKGALLSVPVPPAI